MRIVNVVAAVLAASTLCVATSTAQQPIQQGRADPRTERVAILPFVNQTGNASLNALPRQIEEAVAARAAGVSGAELIRVSTTEGVRATDPLATIASRTRASMIVRGTISLAGNAVVLDASSLGSADGKVIHHLPVERAPASDPAAAVDRLAKRIAGMLALHADREQTNPQLYSVPTLEAYRLYKRADTLFTEGRPGVALPLIYQGYQLDSMYVSPLFLAVAIHNNAGRAAVGDSVLKIVEARTERLTEIERLFIPWFRGPPANAYVAAKTALQMDPSSDMWNYGVGFRANGAGYFRDAVEPLSRRAALAAQGSRSAHVWPAWRGQLMTALHATGDYERELAEVKLARTELLGANENTYYAQELEALAALGRVEELRAVVARQMVRRIDSVNVIQLESAGLELKRHGHRQEGERVIAELAEFAMAHEAALDSLTVASALALARRYDEALPRLAKLAEGSSNYTRVGRYGVFATFAGKREIADQVMSRLTQMGDNATSHMWRGLLSAAAGNCEAAVADFRTGVEKGLLFTTNWWHSDPSTEPIWGCEAFEKLPPMKAP